MMVGMVKKVNYSKDNSVCSIEVLQCPPRGAMNDNIYVDISADSAFHPNYCIRVTDVLEREMQLAYNTDSGSFSKKRKVGKHGHPSNLVAKTSIDAFYQQRPVSKPVVRQCEVPCDQMNKLEGGHNTDFFEQSPEKLGEIIHHTSNFFARPQDMYIK